VNTQANYARTPLAESGCLMTDAKGGDLLAGDWGAAPGPCPAQRSPDRPSRLHLPIGKDEQSFAVASRRVPALQPGDSLDVAANVQMTMPDMDDTDVDEVYGAIVLADSPTATGGVVVAPRAGGTIDEKQYQHHYPLTNRGNYRTRDGDAPVRWAQAGTLYANFVVTTVSPSQRGGAPCGKGQCTDPCSESGTVDRPAVCVDANYSQMSVQTFRPATRGDRLMAVDAMTATPVRAVRMGPGYQNGSFVPVWTSPPMTDLAPGEIVQAHADLAFTYEGAGGRCEPNIEAQVFLTKDPTLARIEDGSATIPISGQVNTNLTPDQRTITLSPFGSMLVQPQAQLQYRTLHTLTIDWSGPWYVVVAAYEAQDSGCAPLAVTVEPSGRGSDAAAFRFRAAAPGTPGWQEASSSSVEPLVTQLGPGAPAAVYATARLPSGHPSHIVDVASSLELRANGCAAVASDDLVLGGKSVVGAVNAAVPRYPGRSYSIAHGGAAAVLPAAGAAAIELRASASSAGCPAGTPLVVEGTGGGVWVESFWQTPGWVATKP
jgi:hypothetical protein